MVLLSDQGIDSRLPCVEDLDARERLALQHAAAAAAGLPVRFEDRLRDGSPGPALIVVPAGLFHMGSPPEEFGRRAEEGPQQLMFVSRPFAIGRYTVTAEQFERFVRASGWRWRSDLIRAQGAHPVMNIRLREAMEFAAWLSEETGEHYRLPTEAEWEYAARAGSTTAFHFGDTASCREVHFNPSFPYEEARQNRKWFLPRCMPSSGAMEVGSKPPNLWGLHEVHGNVWEFTLSRWTESHVGVDRDAALGTLRKRKWITVRGGSYFDSALLARSAARRPRVWDELDVNLGFRLLRELD